MFRFFKYNIRIWIFFLFQVYGVPIETTLYLCRLCCLAYESKAVYQKHVRTHGVLQNCEQCSVVAFNEDQMKAHRAQHLITTERNQRLVYVCSKCIAAYSTVRLLLFLCHFLIVSVMVI